MEELVKQLMGKTKQDAEALLTRKGLHFRYTAIDGEARIVTRDVNPYRVNLELTNGVVTKVDFG